MQTSIVIPARLESTRLPRKLLLDLSGKPVIHRVCENALRVQGISNVIVATDSVEIEKSLSGLEVKVVQTSSSCRSGTERIIEVMKTDQSDFYVNLQGDEPFVPAELVELLIREATSRNAGLITAVSRITSSEELHNPNKVKVVNDAQGCSIYFSRQAIPYPSGLDQEEWVNNHRYWGHIGIYGYNRAALDIFAKSKVGVLETLESLEQLRFIENGLKFQTVVTEYEPIGIDTQEDLERARQKFISNAI